MQRPVPLFRQGVKIRLVLLAREIVPSDPGRPILGTENHVEPVLAFGAEPVDPDRPVASFREPVELRLVLRCRNGPPYDLGVPGHGRAIERSGLGAIEVGDLRRGGELVVGRRRE